MGADPDSIRALDQQVEPHERSVRTNHDPHPLFGDRYRIRVGGHLDDRWSDRLDAAVLTRLSDGTTAVEVRAIDQAALHGLLGRIRDAGLRLISVVPVDTPTEPD